ncbi:MAG: twin-arginine translocase TatA/TatE family subunit [Acidimicrobiales bacterium]
MPFNFGPEKILVILVFALIFLGPDKLPEAARKLGEWLGHARRLTGDLQGELRQALDEPMQTITREFGIGEQKANIDAAPTPAAETASATAKPDADVPTEPAAVGAGIPLAKPEQPAADPPQADPIASATPATQEAPATSAPPERPTLPAWVFPANGTPGRGQQPGFH